MKIGKWVVSTAMLAVLLVGCSRVMDDKTIIEIPQEGVTIPPHDVPLTNEQLNELVQNIEWTFAENEWTEQTTVTGVLENTTDKTIEYIEIEYKFIRDGITVESAFTNLINIEPGEKMLVELYCFRSFDTLKVKGSSGF